jgi:hypothetical protein
MAALVTGYASLVTAVADYTARAGVVTDAPALIQAWESRFYRQPKNHGRFMERALSAVIASSVIAVPDDYLRLKVAYVNGSPSSRLERVSLEQLLGRYPRGSGTGIPAWMAREVDSFVFGPEPDSAYTIKGVYYGKPTALRSTADDAAEHWLIVNAPDLALFGSLLEAEPYLKNDARIPVWERKYEQALKDYRDGQTGEEESQSAQEVLA